MGAIGGVMYWGIGGWWQRVRIGWSGAPRPDKRLARLVYIYASFVAAGPAFALALIQTAFYANYAEAYAGDEMYSMVILVFPFWSLVTSIIGVRSLFEVIKWRALLWFLILPGILYFFAFGLVALLFAFAGSY